MWIFLSDAFLSIVAHREKPGVLLVRARAPGDISAVFPTAEVKVTPGADYRYRAEVPAAAVAEVLAARVRDIAYPNFKDTVRDPARHDAYLDVWADMRVFGRTKSAA
jgi:hypothetical protein